MLRGTCPPPLGVFRRAGGRGLRSRQCALRRVDVTDLVQHLFGTLDFGFTCEAASDVNNDGAKNIVDVISLVQGVIVGVFTIPAPNSMNPGLGIPGAVTLNGGVIPSVLNCAEGGDLSLSGSLDRFTRHRAAGAHFRA